MKSSVESANIAERWLKWHVARSLDRKRVKDKLNVSEIPQLNKGKEGAMDGPCRRGGAARRWPIWTLYRAVALNNQASKPLDPGSFP